jgi:endo-1,4-beta-xylanase
MKNQILILLCFSIILLGICCAEIPRFTTLKEAYGATFAIGCSSANANMSAEQLAIARANFTNITPGNVMKPQPIGPQGAYYHFEAADEFVSVAQAQGLKINGHS